MPVLIGAGGCSVATGIPARRLLPCRAKVLTLRQPTAVLILYAATSNRGKLAEFQAAAAEAAKAGGPLLRVEPVLHFPSLPACPEDGSTFEENARKKALHYSSLAGGLVFADDSGLEVQALGGAPGVLSARYSGAGATDARNNQKLLSVLEAFPAAPRQARFVCVIALAQEGRLLDTFEGYFEGLIANIPRGSGGFGYDPLFLLPELGRTFAELAPEEKWRYSHRGRAFRALLQSLKRGDK